MSDELLILWLDCEAVTAAASVFTISATPHSFIRNYTHVDQAQLQQHQFIQEAQLMLTKGSTHLAVSRGQQTWYHSTCYI